jgi:hypothetical protein
MTLGEKAAVLDWLRQAPAFVQAEVIDFSIRAGWIDGKEAERLVHSVPRLSGSSAVDSGDADAEGKTSRTKTECYSEGAECDVVSIGQSVSNSDALEMQPKVDDLLVIEANPGRLSRRLSIDQILVPGGSAAVDTLLSTSSPIGAAKKVEEEPDLKRKRAIQSEQKLLAQMDMFLANASANVPEKHTAVS